MKQEHVDRMWGDIVDGARRRDAGKPEPRPRRRMQQREPMLTREYTDDEWTELGRQMADNPKAITTNIEGKAYLDYTNAQRWQRIERYGCCGDEPDIGGYCFGFGKCPRFEENRRFVEFTANFLKWIDDISEQTSLAAVAVRLSDSSSFTSEVSNV